MYITLENALRGPSQVPNVPQWMPYLVANKMIQAPSYYGCENQQGIVTHEWGHALGLAHVYSPTVAVIRDDIAGLSYAVPKVDDVNGLDALY